MLSMCVQYLLDLYAGYTGLWHTTYVHHMYVEFKISMSYMNMLWHAVIYETTRSVCCVYE